MIHTRTCTERLRAAAQTSAHIWDDPNQTDDSAVIDRCRPWCWHHTCQSSACFTWAQRKCDLGSTNRSVPVGPGRIRQTGTSDKWILMPTIALNPIYLLLWTTEGRGKDAGDTHPLETGRSEPEPFVPLYYLGLWLIEPDFLFVAVNFS